MIKLSQKDYLVLFAKELTTLQNLTESRNSNYANSEDAFANFNLIEIMSGGLTSAIEGILTRMTDKLQRIVNLTALDKNLDKEESIIDNLKDLAVYSIILKIYIEVQEKNNF